jgi:glycosyltransferase involved in cell wall biosynthesis
VPKRLAIVTQDPANYGGVLRLVEYIYRRAEGVGVDPCIVHYGRFAEHPELSVSIANLLRGELNIWPTLKRYTFRGMNAVAIGATLPEWEPNRIRANALWKKELANYEGFLLVTGAAHTGAPLAAVQLPFASWISATVAADRAERLKSSRSLSTLIERLGMLSILNSERKVLQAACCVMAVSNAAKEELSSVSEHLPEVWPFPVDTGRFTPDSNAQILPRFLFVGRANDPRKRIQLFLEACAELHHLMPDRLFEAVIVSSVSVETGDKSVRFVSNISDAELIDLYRPSTAMVLTSEQEGLGIAAMEAMACGTPVISTRCGGTETFIEDNISGLFVAADARKIAEAMLSLMTQPALRGRLGSAARTRIASAFSEHRWNKNFEHLILDLTNGVQND